VEGGRTGSRLKAALAVAAPRCVLLRLMEQIEGIVTMIGMVAKDSTMR